MALRDAAWPCVKLPYTIIIVKGSIPVIILVYINVQALRLGPDFSPG